MSAILKPTKDEIAAILAAHKAWYTTGNGQRANLQGADLQGAYLQGAYLWGAYLRGANLQGAYLRSAYLQGAKIGDHKLTKAGGVASRSDGYEFRIFGTETGSLVRAGCRTFTPAEFKKHTKTYDKAGKRKETLAILALLEASLKQKWSTY